nr:RNA-directed DNA polymerase, eukaryota, reverse transcriptase zinc-binding domain protein [Tanacetum cinerariifolium]
MLGTMVFGSFLAISTLLEAEMKDQRIVDLKAKLMEWDSKAELGLIRDVDIHVREADVFELLRLNQYEQSLMKQKNIIKWAVKGDENTKFYHSVVKKKLSKNNIKGLSVNGVWTENPDTIKKVAFDHFQNRFLEPSDLKLLYLKVDFENTFDSVCWSFLDDTIVNMGFGGKWRSWIHGCLSSASVSVLVNGSPIGEFSMKKGLRQGDPISPYLFLMVAESLQVMTIDACSKRNFSGISLRNVGENISLLQYADDALFFEVVRVANVVRCQHDNLSLMYLGLPVAIGEIYGRDGGLSTPNGLGIKKGVWDNIRSIGYTINQLGISFSSSFRRLVGNDESILFWHDRWLDEGPCLKIHFPRLYALDENTNFRLNERLAEIDGSWVLSSAWRSSPRGRSCNELNSSYSNIESCSLNSEALDGWKWTLGSGKDFKAKTLSVMVDSILLEPYHFEQKFKWNSWVPRKINIFAWRAFNDRLPLLLNLDNRGLDVYSQFYSLFVPMLLKMLIIF